MVFHFAFHLAFFWEISFIILLTLIYLWGEFSLLLSILLLSLILPLSFSRPVLSSPRSSRCSPLWGSSPPPPPPVRDPEPEALPAPVYTAAPPTVSAPAFTASPIQRGAIEDEETVIGDGASIEGTIRSDRSVRVLNY